MFRRFLGIFKRNGGDDQSQNQSENDSARAEEPAELADATPGNSGLVDISLCGHLLDSTDESEILRVFEEHKIPFEEFKSDPKAILQNPNLILKIEDDIFDYATGIQRLISLLVYDQPLDCNPELSSPVKKPKLEIELPVDLEESKEEESEMVMQIQEGDQHETYEDAEINAVMNSQQRKKPNLEIELSNKDGTVTKVQISPKSKMAEANLKIMKKRYKKVLVPTKEQLDSLNLKQGKNDIKFTILDGKQEVHSRIFLWSWKQKIVISDVDGTITRSDILGHLLPIFGKDWSHDGVAELFTNIKKNNYGILYLTSRAIGQAQKTKDYLS